jgi:acetyl esterase/lipase
MAAMFGPNRRSAPPQPDASGRNARVLAVADGKQAMKLVRERAAEWNVDPNRIGLMGFSAGAILTTGVLIDYDAASRPNFAAPIYGMTVDPTKVPADAPPIFIACAEDDPLLPSTNSANLFAAWKNGGMSPSCISTRKAATVSACISRGCRWTIGSSGMANGWKARDC